jgi:hypothetical protein
LDYIAWTFGAMTLAAVGFASVAFFLKHRSVIQGSPLSVALAVALSGVIAYVFYRVNRPERADLGKRDQLVKSYVLSTALAKRYPLPEFDYQRKANASSTYLFAVLNPLSIPETTWAPHLIDAKLEILANFGDVDDRSVKLLFYALRRRESELQSAGIRHVHICSFSSSLHRDFSSNAIGLLIECAFSPKAIYEERALRCTDSLSTILDLTERISTISKLPSPAPPTEAGNVVAVF